MQQQSPDMLNNGAPSVPANTNITTEQIQKVPFFFQCLYVCVICVHVCKICNMIQIVSEPS